MAYLVERLGPVAASIGLYGLYGLERADAGRVLEVDGAGAWRQALADLADRAEREAPPGVAVERKGLAVTLHVRNAPGAAQWAEAFAGPAASAAGLTVHPGRMSVEIRPPVDTDKGTVVRELGAGRAAVCFLGDDRGDLPAFAELHNLRAQGTFTLSIAVLSSEVPMELLDQADVLVDGPPAALALLGQLAAGRSRRSSHDPGTS